MALNFGKLDFSTSFNRTSAFPLDSRSYFESLELAQAAAASAEAAGSSNTAYYYGQTIAVVENNTAELYIITPDKELKKLGEGGGGTTSFYVGYYLNNEFYKDTTYTEPLPHNNAAIYADLNGSGFYRYTGDLTGYQKFNAVDIPLATDEVAGIMKLYNTHGQNTNGTMTQKAITDGVSEIKFAIETSDEDIDGDGNNENILVLDLPWDN